MPPPPPLPLEGHTAVAEAAAAALGRRSGTKMAQVALPPSPSFYAVLSSPLRGKAGWLNGALPLERLLQHRHPRERGLVAWKGGSAGERPFERRSAVEPPCLPTRRTFSAPCDSRAPVAHGRGEGGIGGEHICLVEMSILGIWCVRLCEIWLISCSPLPGLGE